MDFNRDGTIPKAESLPEFVTQPGERDRVPKGPFSVGSLLLGRYKILSELGTGGMGAVYKCFDETAGVEVAMKVIPPELARFSLEMEGVRENFRLVKKLVHENIAVHDVLQKDSTTGEFFLIMEYVDGVNLREWLKQKRQNAETVSLDTTVSILSQVADAIDFAHRKKVVHRDIKPENIMVAYDGGVKILDFGLAAQIHTAMTRVSQEYQNRQTGHTSGTIYYMSPEQWRGRQQNAKTDQYALAVVAYEMLAGHLPFDVSPGMTTDDLKKIVLEETAAAISNIPRSAQNAIARAMNKEPSKRFANGTKFVSAVAWKNM